MTEKTQEWQRPEARRWEMKQNNQTKARVWVEDTSSAESQKGAIADQRCSVENKKGAIAIDFVQW